MPFRLVNWKAGAETRVFAPAFAFWSATTGYRFGLLRLVAAARTLSPIFPERGAKSPRTKALAGQRFPKFYLCRNHTDKLLSNRWDVCRARVGYMENHFVKITDLKSFEDLSARSKERAVVIFKHSLTCPISSAAYDEMTAFDGEVALLEVQRSRELSQEIEDRLGVVHESPQVIVLRNGQVVWNASHFRITADAVAGAVRDAEATSQ